MAIEYMTSYAVVQIKVLLYSSINFTLKKYIFVISKSHLPYQILQDLKEMM